MNPFPKETARFIWGQRRQMRFNLISAFEIEMRWPQICNKIVKKNTKSKLVKVTSRCSGRPYLNLSPRCDPALIFMHNSFILTDGPHC